MKRPCAVSFVVAWLALSVVVGCGKGSAEPKPNDPPPPPAGPAAHSESPSPGSGPGLTKGVIQISRGGPGAPVLLAYATAHADFGEYWIVPGSAPYPVKAEPGEWLKYEWVTPVVFDQIDVSHDGKVDCSELRNHCMANLANLWPAVQTVDVWHITEDRTGPLSSCGQ